MIHEDEVKIRITQENIDGIVHEFLITPLTNGEYTNLTEQELYQILHRKDIFEVEMSSTDLVRKLNVEMREKVIIKLIRSEQVTMGVDDNGEPVFWAKTR